MPAPVDPALESEKSESRREVASAPLSDYVALAKPRITTMVVITTAGGLWLAHRASLTAAGASALTWPVVLCTLLGTALLAVLANLSYVLAYTPLKQRSHHALLVGAIPGAIPPLLGWTAVTGRIDPAGFVLFAFMFTWQVPHSLAIALFRKGEYARAGLVVMPNVTGDDAVKHAIARWLVPVVASSLLVVPLGLVGGPVYLVTASLLGALFFGVGVLGLARPGADRKWARSLFGVSLVYLVGVFAAMVLCA